MKNQFILLMIMSVLMSMGIFAQDYEITNLRDEKPSEQEEAVGTRNCATVVVTGSSSFFEDFNSITEEIPDCWDNSEIVTLAGTPYKWSSFKDNQQGRCLRFNSYLNKKKNTNTLKTPVLDLTALSAGAKLNFKYKNPKGGDLSIYLSTDGGTSYSTQIDTGLINQSTWIEKEIVLPTEAIANNVVIAFKGTSNWGNGDAYIYLDDVKVSKIPTCPQITALTVSNITANTADFTWTAGGTENVWNVIVSRTKISNFTTETPISATTESYQATALNANTKYYVYVQANCSGDLAEWTSTNFRTACGTMVLTESNPFIENFNDILDAIPVCWDNSEGTANSEWQSIYTGGVNNSKYLRFDSKTNASGSFNMLKTPILDLTAFSSTGVRLKFAYKNPKGGDFSIYYSTDGGTTYTDEVVTGLIEQSSWSEEEITLPPGVISNNSVLVFKGTSNHSSDFAAYIYLDNVEISKAPSCPKVSNLAISGITAYTADLTWTTGGSESDWNVVVSETKITDFTTVTPITVNTNPYLLTDLIPVTKYYVYVQAKCSDDDLAEWSKHATFTTTCGTYIINESQDFFENFNGIYTGIPECWDNSEGTTDNNGYKWTCYKPNPPDPIYVRSLVFNSSNNAIGNTNILKTPTLNLTALTTGARLNFMYMNPTGGDFSIYLSTDGGATYPTELATDLTGQETWLGKEITLPPEAIADNVKIIFKGTSNKAFYDANAYIDNVRISKLPSCHRITDLTISDVTANTADLEWTAGSVNSFNLIISETEISDFTSVTSTITVNNTNSYEATGLTPTTQYYVYIQAQCSSSESSEWSYVKTFETPCNTFIVDETTVFFEDFTGVIGQNLPDCWDKSDGTTVNKHFKWYSYNNTERGRYLQFNSKNNASGHTNMLKTSPLNLTALTGTGARLNFMYNNPTGGDFSVYISTDGGVTYATTLATNLTNQTEWVEKEIILPVTALTNNVVIVFKATSNHGTGKAYIRLDDVKVSKIPTCPKITELTASNITAYSADLSWTAGGTEANWNVIVSKTEVSDFNTKTPIELTANSYIASNLTPATEYYVYVQAKCSDDDLAEWSNMTFKTPCGTYIINETTNFFEDFNDINAEHPDCWDIEDGTIDDYMMTWFAWNEDEKGMCMRFESQSNDDGETNMLKTPILNLSALTSTGARLNFMYKNDGGGDLSVFLSTDGGVTYTTKLDTALIDQADWIEKEIPLPQEALADNIKIVFRGTSNYGNENIWIDDIKVSKLPTCPKITKLMATNITANTTDLSWTNGRNETAWKVIYGAIGFNPISEGTTVDATTNPYTLQGLDSDTEYDVYVQAKCSDTELAELSDGTTFRTPCSAVIVTESSYFIEDFNGITTGIPNCWDNSEGTTTKESYKWYSFKDEDQGRCLKFNSYNNTKGKTNILKTRVLNLSNLTSAGAVVNFMYKNPEDGDLSIYLSTDGGANYSTELATGLINQEDWVEKEILLPQEALDDNIVIIFKGTSNYGEHNIYIDDVKVSKVPTCPKITNLTKGIPTITEVEIRWTNGKDESAWKVIYGANGFNPENEGSTVDVTTNPYTLQGLNADTDYDIYVRANCGTNDLSELVGPLSITTQPTCPAPTTLTAEDPTANSVELSWTAGGTETKWKVIYGAENFNPNTDGTTVDATTNPFTLTGLAAETAYDIYVKANCNAGDLSKLTSLTSITTLPTCPRPTELTLEGKTKNSVNLSWTTGSTETKWKVIYGANNFDPATSGTTVDVTTNPFTLTGLTAGTEYDIYVKANCGAGDLSSLSSKLDVYLDYCDASPTSVDSKGITNVTFGQFSIVNNNTEKENQNYGDFSSMIGDAAQGSNVNLDITYYTGYTYGTKVYVDWNNDLDFDDNGELVYAGESTKDKPTTLSTTFTVPLTTPLGNYRMRIVGSDNGTQPPCYNGSYGCVEDYTLQITEASSCMTPTALTAGTPNKTDVELSWTAGGSESAWKVIYGATGFDPLTNGTTVDATTNPFTLTGLTAETTYNIYVKAKCGAGDLSELVGPVSITTSSLSAEAELLTYSIPNQIGNSVINDTTKTIALTMPAGTDLTNLVASFTISDHASIAILGINQLSGTTPNNFTNSVIYTITAENGTTQAWTINVTSSSIYTVTFNVKDPENKALENVTININSQDLITNVNGEASIELPNGDYNYTANRTNYDEVTGSITVADSLVIKEVVMTKTIVNYLVTFNVKDPENKALENVTININNQDLITNVNGEASIELPNGDYNYTANRTNYDEVTGSITVADEDVTEKITLNLNSISDIFNDVIITPNPTSGILTIEGVNLYTVEVLSMTGRVLYKTNMIETKTTIDITNYQSGIYIIRLSKDGQFNNKKIIKQ